MELLEEEGYFHVNAPFNNLAILDYALDILNPSALNLVKCLVGALDAGFNSVFNALWRRRGKFDYFCNCCHDDLHCTFGVFSTAILA
jgi:hypothetical protein